MFKAVYMVSPNELEGEMHHKPIASNVLLSDNDPGSGRGRLSLPALTYSIKQACEMSSLGRTSLYARIRSGEIQTTKVGRRTLIRAASMHDFLGIDE